MIPKSGLINVMSEGLSRVSHYHNDAHRFYRMNVAVVGGDNSAAEAALDLSINGLKVVPIHRNGELNKRVKYR